MTRTLLLLLFVLLTLAGFEKARAAYIVLNWSASASTNVAGYNVYYGTNSGNYPYKINVGSSTSVTISNLPPGITYYLSATAYDALGNESAFSSEISYLLPGVVTMAPRVNPGSPAVLRFPVAPGHWYEVQATTNLQTWTSLWQSGVMTSNVWMQFSDSGAASFTSRYYRLVMH